MRRSALKTFSMLTAVMMVLVMFPGLLPGTYAETVTTVTATMSEDPASICKLGDPIDTPVFTTTSGSPAEVVNDSASWDKNGDATEDTEFTKGIWRLWVAVILDGDTYPGDSLSPTVTLTVDGKEWILESFYPADSGDPEWVAWFYYPEDIDLSGGSLVFVRDPGWDIPVSTMNAPIASFSVASGVKGGKAPYKFSKHTGPEWIEVSEDGKVSGTPTGFGANEELVILVRDDNGDMAIATVYVENTKYDDREAVDYIMITADDVEDVAVCGGTVKPLDITVDYPSGVEVKAGSGCWKRFDKDAGVWAKQESGDKFYGGQYRYQFEFTVDSHYTFSDPILEDSINVWYLQDCDQSGAVYHSQIVEVPYLTDKVEITGIPFPVDGKMPDFSGMQLNDDTLTVIERHWSYDSGSGLVECDASPFESGKEYYAVITLGTHNIDGLGHIFADDVSASVNHTAAAAVKEDSDVLTVTARVPMADDTLKAFVVTAGSLNIRDDASPKGKRLGGLGYGDFVLGNLEVNGWVMIKKGTTVGWVDRRYIALTLNEYTCIDPVKYTITAGAVNVRSEPDSTVENRIGSVTYGKEVLVTGITKDGSGDEWLVLDYEKDGTHQLGFLMKKYSYDPSEVEPDKEPLEEKGASAEEESDAGDLEVGGGWTYPTVTLEPLKSNISVGNLAEIGDADMEDTGEGTFRTTIYPDDAVSFENLKAEDIKLSSVFTDNGLEVLELMKNADGSITLKLGVREAQEPEVPEEPGDDTDVRPNPKTGTGIYTLILMGSIASLLAAAESAVRRKEEDE